MKHLSEDKQKDKRRLGKGQVSVLTDSTSPPQNLREISTVESHKFTKNTLVGPLTMTRWIVRNRRLNCR